MSAFYAEDLAHIHDQGFGSFAQAATPFVLRTLASRATGNPVVVELGCGSGITATALVQKGYSVLGVDTSAAMLEFACKRAPGAELRQASVYDTELPECAAVLSIGECLGYAPESSSKREQLFALFPKLQRALASGGFLLFDLLTTDHARRVQPYQAFREGKGWTVVFEIVPDLEKQELIRRIISFRLVGEHYRRSTETHRIFLYETAEIIQGLRVSGFQVQVLEGYGTLRFREGHLGFLAEKL
ncbi:MAG: class I SAM-dependent methyltransferase [SAR324 cluster bacterium]|nr:class I SAM-dependent methyltransferase [SAR324 cluster bacterium]